MSFFGLFQSTLDLCCYDMVLHALSLTLGFDQERTRRRLFETENLTLDKAIGICRLAEDTEVEMKKLRRG